MGLDYSHPNDPNASRLIESLRCLGYDNYVALADIVDNSLDADATLIRIRIWSEHKTTRIMVADNGIGMDLETLDQALRLGSLTAKDPASDLGRFGMGLVTAGLSLARQTRVVTWRGGTCQASVVDIDQMIETNRFCKYIGDASEQDKALAESAMPGSQSGTVVVFDKCDGIRNQNTTVFANTLRQHLGRIHRYFIKAGKVIEVNGQPAHAIDPLELDNPATEIFSDDSYPVTIRTDGVERTELVRIRIALISSNDAAGEREIALGLKNQGFYILRNNREIKAASSLGAFTRHNDFNRMRGEIFLTGELDKAVGIDFTKRETVFDQSLSDQLLRVLKPQCSTIKHRESARTRSSENEEVVRFHRQAEKAIDQKARLLITPKKALERPVSSLRKRPNQRTTSIRGLRENTTSEAVQAKTGNCEFQAAKLGPNGQIYECELVGKTIVIRWNVEHPFYQRFVLDLRSDGKLVTAIDHLIYSMAAAELYTIDEGNVELINSFKAIVSSNVRTLLS